MRNLPFRLIALLGVVVAIVGLTGGQPFPANVQTARASHTAGALRVYAPFGGLWTVTSPSRYHNGCPPDTTTHFDSVKFDNGSCTPAASGDWSIDFADGIAGSAVYIDVEPGTIDGNYGLSVYRVVAGDIQQWNTSANGKYQYFGIHVQTPSGTWENFAWILLGHINNNYYLTPGTVIAGPTSGRTVTTVAQVAPAGSWPVHVHQEFYNYTYDSRSYNWDGPTTDNDTFKGPDCVRSGGSSPAQCNAKVFGSDVIGYVGGNQPSFFQVDNPYFGEF